MTGHRILLVEDNPDDESLTRRGLRRHDCDLEIVRAHDGASALEAMDNMAELPDLVLLDLKLPKLGGIEALRRIRDNERTKLVCVVVFTSSSEPRDITSCYDLRCNSYVVKPVAYEDYIRTVQQIGDYWLKINKYQRP